MDAPVNLPDSVRLANGPGGLARLEIASPLAEAHIFLHGAHVSHFAPAGETPILFLSERSHFQPGKAIRGGVPVIFPWFGPRADDPASPAHGFARTRPWTLESVTEQPGGEVVVTMRLEPNDASRVLWEGDKTWVLRHRVTVAKALTMELEVENTGTAPFRFEEALHTYFSVGDVRDVQVLGLEGAEYLDKADGMRRKRQENAPITFVAETDRTYVNTTAHCTIVDPGLSRRIVVEKTGSASTVVWNPWIAKARDMADYGDDEWPYMVCVETGNVADNTLEVAPGERHVTKTVLRTERIQ